MSHGFARLTITLPVSEHKRLKTAAALMEISMKQLIMLGVESFMQKKPNRVTEKALKQSVQGKNTKKFHTMEELFEDLGI